MASFFFALSIVGALLTLNVHRPIRRLGPLSIPSFMFGWLIGDLPFHQIAIQVVVTSVFVAGGVLREPLGVAGFVITLASWVGLAASLPTARRAGPTAQSALDEVLGPFAPERLAAERAAGLLRPPHPRRPWRPFSFTEPGVRIIRDVPYAGDDDPRRHLDLYLPDHPVKDAPVLLQVHGGGWTIGNKREQALPLMNHLAARGWICVAANYRLSPKHAFPAHIIDLKLATAWIRKEIARYGGDPDFVCVTGGSAGGHLTALLALTANDPAWQPGFEEVDTSFRAAVPFYGVYDWTNEHGLQASDLTGFVARAVVQKELDLHRDEFKAASPLHRIHEDAPPFFVIHGDRDSLTSFEEARFFVERLRATSKASVAYAEIPGAQHAFDIFHTPRTQGIVPAVERFLAHVHSEYLASRGQAAEPRVGAGEQAGATTQSPSAA